LNYNFSRNRSEADRRASLFNNLTGNYDITDARQTNAFENTAQMHRLGANYRFFERSYSYQIGIGMQQTALESNNISKRSVSKQSFVNLFPVALFNYQFNRSKSLRIAYRGNTRQPAITQLQDVLDETTAPYYNRGNPQLGQEFSNDVRLTYNFFNLQKLRNVFAVLTIGNTYNQIGVSIRDTAGGQITTPVNISGYYIIAGNFNLGFPIKKLEGMNFNTTTRTFYNQQPSLVNGEKIFTRNFGLGEDLRLNYNDKERFDLGLTASVNYNSVAYSSKVKTVRNESYVTYVYAVDISYSFSKNFIFNSDFDYTINSGRTTGFNKAFGLWNANVTKQFLRNNRGEIKISAFDILNQNSNVSRDLGAGYMEDVRHLTLPRYFLLTLSYNINRMGGKSIAGAKKQTHL